MSLTRAQVASTVYGQVAALWSAASLTYTNDAKGAEGDMTLPIDRALRAMQQSTTGITSATASTGGEEKLLDLAEWYALDRVANALAVLIDVSIGDYSPKASQMYAAARAAWKDKAAYLKIRYNIGGDDRNIGTSDITKDDAYHQAAIAGGSSHLTEYDSIVYVIRGNP